MRDKNIVVKLLNLITIIILYYVSGKNTLFMYASTICLYNVYLSCFQHITIKEILKKYNYHYSKLKILKYVSINIIIICLLFLISSILISDAINIFLKIENTFLPYLIMSLSIITEPLIKILLEYLQSYNKPKLSNSLLNLYYIIEFILLILISIITIRIIKMPIYISVSLLYLSKIISFVIISVITYLNIKKENIKYIKVREEKQINYKNEIKEILKNNNHKSIINVVKNSYYYISLIILYAILESKYSYSITTIEKDLTFLYLYGLTFINFVIDIIKNTSKSNKSDSVINYIYIIFEKIITITIIISITSPLICKIIFNNSENSMYLMMLSFLSIFIVLYNTTYEYIKSKKIIYTSLILGIISKLILTIPLFNSFYRMGYNLIYGDIISTIIGTSISIAINYVYIKIKNKNEKTFEKILGTLYESILLCIILVIFQFIVPITKTSYIKSILILMLYISISVMFIKLNIRLKKKQKRG